MVVGKAADEAVSNIEDGCDVDLDGTRRTRSRAATGSGTFTQGRTVLLAARRQGLSAPTIQIAK